MAEALMWYCEISHPDLRASKCFKTSLKGYSVTIFSLHIHTQAQTFVWPLTPKLLPKVNHRSLCQHSNYLLAILHDGCIETNENKEATCEDSQTETHSNCGGNKYKEMW